MAKLVFYNPSYLVFLSDKNQAEGLPSCFENFEPSSLPSKYFIRKLHAEINLLPSIQKQIIKYYLKGKKDTEIALKLKIKPKKVWTERHKAIVTLRLILCKKVHIKSLDKNKVK